MPLRPECPRCGYDQSGLVETWKDRCPLTGTCSECGHTLDWRIVMRPELIRLPGLYEHARRFWSYPSALRTWSWAARPPVFARKVTLDHAPSVIRLLLWLPMLVLPLHLLVAAARSATWLLWTQPSARGGVAPAFAQPYDFHRHLGFWTTPIGHFQTSPYGTRGWSASWYSFFRTSPSFIWVGIAVMLAVPATLLLLTQTRARSKVRAGHLLRFTVYGLAWVPLVFLVTTANAVHTLWMSWQAYGIGTGVWRTSPISGFVLGNRAGYWLIGVVAWSMVWWWYAVVRVLRLHQAWFVWAVMMVVALLAGVVMYVFAGDARLMKWLQ